MPESPYTRERLAEAASASRTLTEALGKLGVDPRSGTRRYLRDRMRRLGVDTSHFEREGARWTREVLEPVVAVSTSIQDVLRRLGIDAVGGHHTHISRRVAVLGINTTHFTTRRGRPKGSLGSPLRLRRPEDGRVPGRRLRRHLLLEGVEERCSMCGTGPEWNGKPLQLEVDHINAEWWDNRLGNLRFLCPNCHAVTDTYRGRRRRSRG
ncbi:HNH endonuclease signature motif containing protein [Streptomyces sp. NPDC013457]|uniref:HNH endonuclease signature motif containing protein n=1 Tax=Streptomyces sp. NPDC013457 TaxID=3364866 RepID=UPI0036FDD9E0